MVPTDVLSHLVATQLIPDPFVERDDLKCRWVEDLDWAFRAQFELDATLAGAQHGLDLVLQDVDCWGEVFVNAKRVGAVGNAFREHRLPVDDAVTAGANEIIIYLRSAKCVNAALERVHGALPGGFDTARVHARRCQCLTGWDWAARLSSAGILSPPFIEAVDPFTLTAPFVYVRELPEVEPAAETAEFAVVVASVNCIAQRKAKGLIACEIVDETSGQTVASAEARVSLSSGRATTRVSLRLRNPGLWWPVGMGSRRFHTARFQFTGEDRAGIAVSAATDTRFAVRTATVRRKKDAAGESFVPVVNGVPVFCRGANWIPVSMLPAQIVDDDYRRLIAQSAAAGMNCLRVWGGGIYERDIFYDLCDRLGILVWQDFMFACAAYPVYGDFLREVELEAEYQIHRLRNHPSLLLWCGNNENEWLHQLGELRSGEEKKIIGEAIWSSLLSDKVDELDPSRVYYQSSPYGRDRADFNDQGSGDRHNWECWARWQNPAVYLADAGRFLSEFGFQGFPVRETVDRFAPAADAYYAADLVHHNRMVEGHERLARYAAGMLGSPASLTDWIDATQRMQAEILRRAVEHWRRAKFHTAGALIWQLNDAYTAISWSLIDFHGTPKPALDAARRFFAPSLLSVALMSGEREVGAFRPRWHEAGAPGSPSVEIAGTPAEDAAAWSPGDRLSFVWVNDTTHHLAGTLCCTTVNGTEDEAHSVRYPVRVPPNSTSAPVSIILDELKITDPASQWVRIVLEPDSPSAEALQADEDALRAEIAGVLAQCRDLPLPRVGFASAHRLDLLLVEPRDFCWPEGLVLNGWPKPAWFA
jgi:beta-mannosidase